MADPYLGQIEAFAFGYVPRGWLACNGAILPINQYQALFALLGTTYGGNGTTNFMLPNLNGRIPMGAANLSSAGQASGEENHTLLLTEIPQHTHVVVAQANTDPAATGGTDTPSAGTQLGAGFNPTASVTENIYSAAGGVALPVAAVANAGSNQPHSNMMPYLAINYCICMAGIFPSRN